MVTAPVLFLVFNRPELTERVWAAIREAMPSRLYVAADGPRPGRRGEGALCEEVRRIVTAIDWPCEVRTLFRTTNLGCRRAVNEAVDWFFHHEQEGIILEDDCLPGASFFLYCDELLEKYRSSTNILAICGSSYGRPGREYDASYYFSYYADMWGWATWRRAWNLHDPEMSAWPDFRRSHRMRLCSFLRGRRGRYWTECFDAAYARIIDTWDYAWIFSVILNRGLVCFPTRNLISNIGYGLDATHTIVAEGDEPSTLADRPVEELEFPLVHPRALRRSDALDRRIEEVRLGFVPGSSVFVTVWRDRLRRLGSSPSSLIRGFFRRLVRGAAT